MEIDLPMTECLTMTQYKHNTQNPTQNNKPNAKIINATQENKPNTKKETHCVAFLFCVGFYILRWVYNNALGLFFCVALIILCCVSCFSVGSMFASDLFFCLVFLFLCWVYCFVLRLLFCVGFIILRWVFFCVASIILCCISFLFWVFFVLRFFFVLGLYFAFGLLFCVGFIYLSCVNYFALVFFWVDFFCDAFVFLCWVIFV